MYSKLKFEDHSIMDIKWDKQNHCAATYTFKRFAKKSLLYYITTRSNLDYYYYVIFDQANNKYFHKKTWKYATQLWQLKFIQPSPNAGFRFRNPNGIRHTTTFLRGLNLLQEDKLKYKIFDSLSTLSFLNEHCTLLSKRDIKLLGKTGFLRNTIFFRFGNIF